MKISFIVAPGNTQHLIRCVNSIYRQLDGDFYVILAENELKSVPEDFQSNLNRKKNLFRISDDAHTVEEKIEEAIRLIPSDSERIMFVDMTYVLSPTASKVIAKQNDSHIILTSAANVDGKSFDIDRPEFSDLIKCIELYPVCRFCFDRQAFDRFLPEFFTNQYGFVMYMLSLAAELGGISVTDDICLYTDEKSTAPKLVPELKDICEYAMPLIEKLSNVSDVYTRVCIFDKITDDMVRFVYDQNAEIRTEAFSVFQYACTLNKKDAFLSRLLELKTGCNNEFFLSLSSEEYLLWQSNMNGVRTADSNAPNGRSDNGKKELDSVKKELSDLKAAMAKLDNHIKQAAAYGNHGSSFNDPVEEIPMLYANGKLGFKIIWRSFKSWLGFKIKGKKSAA